MIDFVWPAGKAAGILVVDNAIDEMVTNHFVATFSSVADEIGSPGETMGGINQQVKSSLDFVMGGDTYDRLAVYGSDLARVMEETEVVILEGLRTAVSYYRAEMPQLINMVGTMDTGFQTQVYRRCDGYYREHCDALPWLHDSNDRVLGAVVYLNTVKQGGETHFTLQDLKVQPVAGRICLFPSSFIHPHQGLPSYTSDKWIVSTFIMRADGSPEPMPLDPHPHPHPH